MQEPLQENNLDDTAGDEGKRFQHSLIHHSLAQVTQNCTEVTDEMLWPRLHN